MSAETCPHYLALTDERYDDPDPTSCARYVISPPLRTPADRDALWAGPGRRLARPRRHRPRPRPRRGREGRGCRGVPFDEISNGAPGIETLLALLYGEGVARGRITVERMVDLLATTPARLFGLATQGRASRSAATPTSSCSTRRPAGRSGPPTSITRATTRRTRASRSRAPSATFRPRATGGPRRRVRRRRGAGAYVERGAIGADLMASLVAPALLGAIGISVRAGATRRGSSDHADLTRAPRVVVPRQATLAQSSSG